MDLIDRDAYRQELENAVVRNLRAGRPNPIVLMVLRYAIAKLDDAPVIDAIPVRHGKWKKIGDSINCSACKSSSWSVPFEDLVTSFNYCPNCGAKMDEKQENKMKPSEVFRELFGELADKLILTDIDEKTCLVSKDDGESFPFEVHP